MLLEFYDGATVATFPADRMKLFAGVASLSISGRAAVRKARRSSDGTALFCVVDDADSQCQHQWS